MKTVPILPLKERSAAAKRLRLFHETHPLLKYMDYQRASGDRISGVSIADYIRGESFPVSRNIPIIDEIIEKLSAPTPQKIEQTIPLSTPNPINARSAAALERIADSLEQIVKSLTTPSVSPTPTNL